MMALTEHSISDHFGYPWYTMTIVEDGVGTNFLRFSEHHLTFALKRDWVGFRIVFKTKHGVVRN